MTREDALKIMDDEFIRVIGIIQKTRRDTITKPYVTEKEKALLKLTVMKFARVCKKYGFENEYHPADLLELIR